MGLIEGSRSRVLKLELGEPAKGTTEAVHAAVTDTGEAQEVTTEITNPPEPRALTATAGGTEADIKAIQVTVEGTNADNETITEELPAFTVNTAGTVEGSKAFKTVTKITIPAHDGEEATTAVGLSDKLGLGVKLDRDSIIAAFLAGELEGTRPTVAVSESAVESNTANLNGELDGEKAVVIDYYTTE